MKKYIVRRPFKSVGMFYGVGSVIEDPTKIKRFKSKVKEGKIVSVDKDNLEHMAKYIKVRTGTDIREHFKPKADTKPKNDTKPNPKADTDVKHKADTDTKVKAGVKSKTDTKPKAIVIGTKK
jgi:hypothetical protein